VAKDHKDWTTEQWSEVLWSDESGFTLFSHGGHKYVRRRPGEELLDECLEKTVKYGGRKNHDLGLLSRKWSRNLEEN
jgi:hypothetical protein